jgi:hypothetical protein
MKQRNSPEAIAACVQTLNHTIGELARSYGVASVVAALTEVMGCASCVLDSVERGTSMRALVERMSSLHETVSRPEGKGA